MYPRSRLVAPGQDGTYHCISRCVRRAFLCGFDKYSHRSFEHRREWVEKRLFELSDLFAVSLLGYAVMANHLHVVLTMLPSEVERWDDADVARRWVRLFGSQEAADLEQRREALRGDRERLARCRARLGDLSWFMRCLSEPIARRANAEDDVTGRFWEGRFKCQSLLDEQAVLAAMTYVDLNPVRAGAATNVVESAYTSIAQRANALAELRSDPHGPLEPLAGIRGSTFDLSVADYIELVDFTGRRWDPEKVGCIAADEPAALRRLGVPADRWSRHVRGVRGGYWRAIGSVEALADKARRMSQRWLRGIGLARRLARLSTVPVT